MFSILKTKENSNLESYSGIQGPHQREVGGLKDVFYTESGWALVNNVDHKRLSDAMELRKNRADSAGRQRRLRLRSYLKELFHEIQPK